MIPPIILMDVGKVVVVEITEDKEAEVVALMVVNVAMISTLTRTMQHMANLITEPLPHRKNWTLVMIPRIIKVLVDMGTIVVVEITEDKEAEVVALMVVNVAMISTLTRTMQQMAKILSEPLLPRKNWTLVMIARIIMVLVDVDTIVAVEVTVEILVTQEGAIVRSMKQLKTTTTTSSQFHSNISSRQKPLQKDQE